MILIAIPARLESTRLKHKMLCKLGDKPLLWWSWRRAVSSSLADEVVIATDSNLIVEVMQPYGANCVLTGRDCASGSDRVFEASKQFSEARALINLQGDEPFMPTKIIDATIELLLKTPNADITTASIPFTEEADIKKVSTVKVVTTKTGRALHFSRAPMAGSDLHLGIYAYRPSALQKFCSMPQSKLETAERLEQLRALESDMSIYVHQEHCTKHPVFGIDTQEDLDRAIELLNQGTVNS